MTTAEDSALQQVAVLAEPVDRRTGAAGQPGPRRTDRDVDSRRSLSVLTATTLVGVRLMAIAIPSTEPPQTPNLQLAPLARALPDKLSVLPEPA
jgi:hypothetical protein